MYVGRFRTLTSVSSKQVVFFVGVAHKKHKNVYLHWWTLYVENSNNIRQGIGLSQLESGSASKSETRTYWLEISTVFAAVW